MNQTRKQKDLNVQKVQQIQKKLKNKQEKKYKKEIKRQMKKASILALIANAVLLMLFKKVVFFEVDVFAFTEFLIDNVIVIILNNLGLLEFFKNCIIIMIKNSLITAKAYTYLGTISGFFFGAEFLLKKKYPGILGTEINFKPINSQEVFFKEFFLKFILLSLIDFSLILMGIRNGMVLFVINFLSFFLFKCVFNLFLAIEILKKHIEEKKKS